MKIKKKLVTSIILVMIALTGCDSGSSETVTGVLADGVIGNAVYKCASTTGYTNTKGEFTCPIGSAVDFYYGNIKLGGVTKLPSDKIVLIQDVLSVERSDVNNAEVTRLAQFLQSLDDNSIPK
ncbi:MAG: hypothetical protein GQ570_03345 [Helicobacteraceae bacterium]|nr:hypothetical protein [Helicobacteraceae bacterium]